MNKQAANDVYDDINKRLLTRLQLLQRVSFAKLTIFQKGFCKSHLGQNQIFLRGEPNPAHGINRSKILLAVNLAIQYSLSGGQQHILLIMQGRFQLYRIYCKDHITETVRNFSVICAVNKKEQQRCSPVEGNQNIILNL